MFTKAAKKHCGSPEDAFSVSGITIAAPPLLEDRLYYVPPEADAYERPIDEYGRTVSEMARSCLLRSGEFLFTPDTDSQTIFRLKRQFGDVGLRYAGETSADPKRPAGSSYDEAAILKSIQIAQEYNSGASGRVIPPNRVGVIAQKINARLHPESLLRSPLHKIATHTVRKFEKTGTETYILPEHHEASVRVIPIEAAMSWLRAFENWPEWYKRGFNYVPIEPIQDIAETNDHGMVAVTTTNLRGQALWQAARHVQEHESQLNEMREHIRSTLSDMRVGHGHLHDGNFIVVPYTKKSGKPDLSRCPRLYAIDFDQAETIGHWK